MKEFFYYWSIIIVESKVQSQKGTPPLRLWIHEFKEFTPNKFLKGIQVELESIKYKYNT